MCAANVTPVLLYHSIAETGAGDPWATGPDDFLADMEAVRSSGRVPLTATQFARMLHGDSRPPATSILVTFDDGYADFLDRAVPVLQRLEIPATLFVTTGWVGKPSMLSAAALHELQSVPSIEIGAHSVTHPHLDMLRSVNAQAQIGDSRSQLSDMLGQAVEAFAYPHGSHRAATRDLVRRCGFVTAHAVKNSLSHDGDDPYAVARYTVHTRTSRREVAAVIQGRGAPLARRREGVLTWAYRPVRLVRQWARR